ncbi:MAG: tripartite tricarboxylate transporter substrate binding protein [Pseudomonadota bacterium]
MFTTPIRSVLGSILATACCAAFFAAPAGAQQKFPNKPITIIVPFNAGGAVDVTIRIISEEAEKSLGQKIMVVNKAGGGATEGQGFVARSKPDGYTLLAGSSSLVTNTITKSVDYTVDSFEGLARYNYDPDVMFVPASEPIKSIEELIAQAKKEPLSAATSGHSTAHHIASILLENVSGAKFKYIHTKGGSEAVPMVAGGHAKTLLGAWGEAVNMVNLGKLRPLAVMSKDRDPRFPDLPTFKEKGWDIAYGVWRGIVAPKGLPKEVKEKLAQAFAAALNSDSVKDRFAKADYTIALKGPDEFDALIRQDYKNVKQILDQLKAERSK